MKFRAYDGQKAVTKFISSGCEHDPLPTTPRGKRRMRARGYSHPEIPKADAAVMAKHDPWKKYGEKGSGQTSHKRKTGK